MAEIWKGATVAAALRDGLASRVAALRAAGIEPTLRVVRVGARSEDLAYERGVCKRFAELGLKTDIVELEYDATQGAFIEKLVGLDADPLCHGILVFRPLPTHLDEAAARRAISPEKDLDCMSPLSVAKVFEGDGSGFPPCTPAAVIEMLKQHGVELTGKRVTIVGRSLVVGRPLGMMLLKENATVTICHTRTRDLPELCRQADILVAAAGRAKMIGADYVSPGQIVIDVGINTDDHGRLCGDVDQASVEPIVAAVTPVPGGVGAVTTSILARNLVAAAERQ